MAVHERTATYFPTFTRAADVVRAETTGYVVAVWSVAVVVLAVLHTVITLAASYWRYAADAAAHDGAVAAVDRFNALARQAGDEWGFQPPGPPALDLDTGAALGQVIAATASFGVLLAVALVLLAHGRTVSAYVAAATTGASVATMAGLLARTSPMIPTHASADPGRLNLDQYPLALRQARIDLDAALVTQDTATWWNYAVAALVALVALAAVEVCRRHGLVYPATASAPVLVDVLVVVVVLGGTALLLGSLAPDASWSETDDRLYVVTLVVAVLAARAAASSRIGTAVGLSVGFALAHGLLYAAFDRDGGAPGGWGVSTGGPQVYASTATAVVLVVTPVLGWIAGAVWAERVARRAVRAEAEELLA